MLIYEQDPVPVNRHATAKRRVFSFVHKLRGMQTFNYPAPVAETLAVALDVSRVRDEYRVTVDLPGLREDDLTVVIRGERLIVEGSRPKIEDAERVYSLTERNFGCFRRILRLPVGVDVGRATARLRQGELNIYLPLHESAEAPAPHAERRIKVWAH